MVSEDDQKKYEEMLARGEQSKGPDSNSNVVWDKKGYEEWLESRLLGADAGTRETILGQLRDLGPKAVESAQGDIHEAEEIARYEVAKNTLSAVAQEAVTTVVSAGMNSVSKDFFDHSLKTDKLLDLDKNGGFDPSRMSSVDEQELKDAFASLELGRMDSKERQGTLAKIKDMLQGKADVSDDDIVRSLNPALDKMERFKATQILEKDKGEDIEKIRTDIRNIHQYFDHARAQVNQIIGLQDNSQAQSNASQEFKESLGQALVGSKEDLKTKLEAVYHILVDKNSVQHAISGGMNPDAISLVLPAGAQGTSKPAYLGS